MSKNATYIRLINTKRWRDLRMKKLKEHPICTICEEKGISTLATEVHHVIPVEKGKTESQMSDLMYNYNNLMSVCHDCHVQIHKEMFSHTKANVKASKARQTTRFVDKYLKSNE